VTKRLLKKNNSNKIKKITSRRNRNQLIELHRYDASPLTLIYAPGARLGGHITPYKRVKGSSPPLYLSMQMSAVAVS